MPAAAIESISSRHRRERAHPSDGVVEELVLREGLDDAPGQPAVSLPVLAKRVEREEESGSGIRSQRQPP